MISPSPSHIRAALLCLSTLSLLSTALPSPQAEDGAAALDSNAAQAINGPVIAADFADPAVMKSGDTYYAYSTNHDGKRCPVATSKNFKDWTVTNKDVLPDLPAWADKGNGESLWGPDVISVVSPPFHTSRVHRLR